ncbi:unnamed protein product [Caenorhabditis sp. 36 PRJEB53466]|nr:unnamed protein product [Caenorhabditis sp. 36 PRJEB53466]
MGFVIAQILSLYSRKSTLVICVYKIKKKSIVFALPILLVAYKTAFVLARISLNLQFVVWSVPKITLMFYPLDLYLILFIWLNLIVWFIWWWCFCGHRKNLNISEICHFINALVQAVLSTTLYFSPMISGMIEKKSWLWAEMGTKPIFYTPFVWILAAHIKTKDPQFQLSVISA